MTVESPVLATRRERALSSAQAYALVAQQYDSQPNPLLALEERIVLRLLPLIAGKCVLDVGCGTGRWLAKLIDHGPREMWGVDTSPEMLSVAAAKLGNTARLSVANVVELPTANGVVDFVMCSFLASYIEDISALARELRRVCRAEATVLLTDVHPETRRKLGWKRAFRVEDQTVVVKTWSHSCEELMSAFHEAGFDAIFELEPEFGTPELAIFEVAGMTKEFERAGGEPAILILGFKPRKAWVTAGRPATSLCINGARIALDACISVKAVIDVRDDRIESIRRSERTRPQAGQCLIDLTGYFLLPGLINAHDHLEFGLFPRLGNRVYSNAHQWALDIYRPEDEPIRSLRKIDKSVRLRWGGIRNLLSGVTTVCQHNEYAPIFDDYFPVRVLRDYGWAHSLAFEDDIQARAQRLSSDEPFFLHLGEGTNAEAEAELWELDQRGLLNSRTVLVHALAVGHKGLELVRARGASVVWCPSSNQFLFGRTLAPYFIDACPSIALGSDSPLTGAGDLLDEIRTAQRSGASNSKIYDLVTVNGASVLRLSKGEGTISPGAMADIVAVPDRGRSPAETLATATYRDIELVVAGGEIKLVSEQLKARLSDSEVRQLSAIKIEDTVRWIAAPVDELLAATESVLGPEIRLGGKRVSRA